MREKVTVRLFPWESGGCASEFWIGDSLLAKGEAETIEQAQARANRLLGDRIGEFQVIAGADPYQAPVEEKSQEKPEPTVLGGKRRRPKPVENEQAEVTE